MENISESKGGSLKSSVYFKVQGIQYAIVNHNSFSNLVHKIFFYSKQSITYLNQPAIYPNVNQNVISPTTTYLTKR